MSLSLWASFILLDEVLPIFETGAEATHFRLLIAELATLVLLRNGQLPRGGEGPSPSAS